MKRLLSAILINIFLLVFILLFAGLLNVNGANRYAVANGNWNATSTWSATSGGAAGASVPGPNDDVIISTTWNRTITLTGNTSCKNITIQNGGTLNLNGHNFTSTGTSILTNQAHITGSGNGTQTLSLGSSITLSDGNSYINTNGYSVMINGNLSLTTQGSINIGSGNLNISGDFSCDGADTHISWTNGNVTIGGNATYRFNNGERGFNCTGNGWLIMNGNSKTLNLIPPSWANSITIPNFRLGSSSISIAGSAILTISDSFDLNNQTSFIQTGGTINVTGTIANYEAMTMAYSGTPTFIYSGGGNLVGGSYYNLTVQTTNAFISCGTTVTTRGTFTNSRTITGPTTVGQFARFVNTSPVMNSGNIGASSSYLSFSGTISGGTVGANVLRSSSQLAQCAVPVPTITPSKTSLTDFSYCYGSGPSASQNFTVSATNLTNTGNITVTGTGNYLVSKDNITFSASVTYPHASGVITGQPKTVYVRLKGGLAAGNYNNENISFSGGGLVSPPTVSNSGIVNALPVAPTTTGALVCIGSTATLMASGATFGSVYKWYSASSGGTPLYTSTTHTDNTFTTPVLSATTSYWVSIANTSGCESARTQVTATFPLSSTDSQTTSGNNSWIGHVYDGTNFNTYFGTFTETETFDRNFGGDAVCFPINSSLGSRSIYTETFSVRYRMNSTKRGLYVVNLGSDDGSRLTVDGGLIYNSWVNQSWDSKPGVLMNLKGNSSLVYDFYENAVNNRIVFTDLTLVLENTLTSNITQSICRESTGATISGDTYESFGTLPAGITKSGTGYQWAYSLSPTGPWTDLPGANDPTYTPSTVGIPAGTYYVIRKATVSSANNVSPNPYVATNESNVATIIVTEFPQAPTANNVTVIYDGLAHSASATVAAGETVDWYTAATGGSPTTAPSGINAGMYTAYAQAKTTAGCMSASRTLVTLTINKKGLTITAHAQNKTYGTTQTTPVTGSAAFTASGLVGSETIGSVTLTYAAGALTATSTVGSTSVITPSGATGGTFTPGNYSITYNTGLLTVVRAAITITATGPAKTYGTALTTGVSATNFTVSGTLASGESVTSVTLTPNAAGLSSTTAAGASYVVTPSLATGAGGFSASNYSITYTPYNGTVATKALTITANAQNKTYGTTQTTPVTGSAAFTASGLVGSETIGSVTLTYAAGALTATSAVGSTSVITPSGATGGTFTPGNYSITYNTGLLTVVRAAITITATGPAKTYGTALTTGVSATNFTVSGTLASGESVTSVTLTPNAAGLSSTTAAGASYVVTPSLATGAGGFSASNYSITYTAYSGTVATKALTITAHAQNKTYGTTQTTPVTGSAAFTASGLVGSETIGSVTLTYAAGALTATSTVGSTSVITPSGATGGTFTPGNYSITYNTGLLTVVRAAITITATGPAKTYGTALTTGVSATNFTVSGTLASGESVTSVTLTPNAAGLSSTTAAGASYVVTPSLATGAGGFSASNYSISYVPYSGIVVPKALTVTANNKSKVYDGTVFSPFTVSYSGFVNGETATVLGGTISYLGTAVTAKNAGTGYVITPGGLTSTNYNISFVNGSLTITQATVVPTVTAQSKCFDGNTNAVISSKTLTGVFPPDNVILLVGSANFNNSDAGVGKTVTATGLSLTGADAANYILSTTTATCTADIIALPTVNISPTSVVVCQGDPQVITLTNPQSMAIRVAVNVAGIGVITIDIPANSSIPYTVPTATPGSFMGSNIRVRYLSGEACEHTLPGSISITITARPSATITYAGSPYCTSLIGTQPVTQTGTAGGTYSASAAGLSINAATGAITPSMSAVGTYTVTYTMTAAGGCASRTTTTTVTILPDGSWTGAFNDDWNDPRNWACNQLPTLTSNVLIASDKAPYPILLDGDPGEANNLIIENGASVTVDGNILQIAGAITSSGALDATAGTIEMIGSVDQIIGADVFVTNTLLNLIVNKEDDAEVTLSGPLSITGVVSPLNGNLNANGKLTLISTADQTALIEGVGTGNVLGDVHIQRYLPSSFGYKYISSPFQSATVAQLAEEVNLTEPFPTLYRYYENNSIDSSTVKVYRSGWVKYTHADSLLIPMHGYAANLDPDKLPVTITMSGEVNNGAISRTLYNHNRKYTKGFNLVGNPYPSPIDWDALLGWSRENIDGSIYFFNAGNTGRYSGTYTSYVNNQSTGTEDNIIAAMQGFFVHVTDGTDSTTLGVTNAVRTNDLKPIFKSATIDPRPTLRLAAGFEIKKAIDDVALVYFEPSAHMAFEPAKDALKLENTDEQVPNIYTLSEGRRLSINGLSEPSDSVLSIPVGITTYIDGMINFRAERARELSFEQVYLADAVTGQYHDLRQLPEVSFLLQRGVYDHRFKLVFSKAPFTGEYPGKEKLFKLIRTETQVLVKVNLPVGTKGSLMVTNVLGQSILRKEVSGKETVVINPKSTSGVYLITLVSGKNTVSEKILMRQDYE